MSIHGSPRIESVPQPANLEPGDKTLLDRSLWRPAVDSAVAEAQVDGTPLCLLLIDLDYFKDVNDLLGHAVGDEVINEVANIVRGNLRKNRAVGDDRPDLISDPDAGTDDFGHGTEGSRIGGDEFGILAHTNKAGAEAIARRMHDAFSDYVSQEANKKLRDTGVGLAIGISEVKPGMTSTELLIEADENLYKNKLNQLPELTEHQKRAISDAKAVLNAAGVRIRLRDFPKYARKYPELFQD